MDINTIATDTSSTSGCDNPENTLNAVTEHVPIKCARTTEDPEDHGNVSELERLDEPDQQHQEITDDSEQAMCSEESRDSRTTEIFKVDSIQNIDPTQESDEDFSTIVLDGNEYLQEESLELPAAPDLSEFCGNINFNDDIDNSLERKTGNGDVRCSVDNATGETYDMVFEKEENESGIETVEVMTISEFIGCNDIGEDVKYMLDPKAKHHFTENEPCVRERDVIPKAKASGGVDMPVTGATGIQTITRKDSETDNVVVIIRPRSDSPSESKRRHQTRHSLSSNHNRSEPVHRKRSTRFSEEIDISEPSSLSRANDSVTCDENALTEESHLVTELRPLESASCKSQPPMLNQSAPTETRTPESGVRRKRWIRQNSNDINSFNETNHSTQSNKEINMDELDPDWDAEDKLIWELLRSMKSVTKRPNDHSETGASDNDSRNLDDTKTISDQDRSEISDNDDTSLTNSEPYTSLSSFGEKEREKIISEKLHKRQAGGVTCITFLSPGYQKPITKFTPIKCKEPLKLDAKGFFQKGFESSRKDSPSQIKETEQTSKRTISSPKLHSPNFFSEQ